MIVPAATTTTDPMFCVVDGTPDAPALRPARARVSVVASLVAEELSAESVATRHAPVAR
jgi:hypothetical protein